MNRANDKCWPTLRDPSGSFYIEVGGLTIREHFAAMAMQGLTACHGTAGLNRGVGDTAERAVQMADALIAELEKQK